MEIAIKGVLGALVAILLHLAATSKHHYLSGLIPLFPTFALFAHTMFASSGRTADMQVSAQFGMLSLVPYGIYLILAWWLAFRLNVWLALTVATIGWAAAATTIIILWNKGGEFIATIFNSPLSIALAAGTYICTWLATRHRMHERVSQTRSAQTAASPRPTRGWFVAMASVASIVLAVGAVYKFRSQSTRDDVRTEAVALVHTARSTIADHEASVAAHDPQEDAGANVILTGAESRDDVRVLPKRTDAEIAARRLTVPPGGDALEQFKAMLILDPGNTAARQGLQCILLSYVALAKSAKSAGKPHLAATYLGRARAVLFGPPAHTEDAETADCE